MWVRLDDENKEILLEWYRSTDHHSFEAMAQALLGEAKGEPKVAPNEAYAKLRDLREAVGVPDGHDGALISSTILDNDCHQLGP